MNCQDLLQSFFLSETNKLYTQEQLNTSAESTQIKVLHLRYLMPVVCQVILWFANLKDRRKFRKINVRRFHQPSCPPFIEIGETDPFRNPIIIWKGICTNKVLNFSVRYIMGKKLQVVFVYVSKNRFGIKSVKQPEWKETPSGQSWEVMLQTIPSLLYSRTRWLARREGM